MTMKSLKKRVKVEIKELEDRGHIHNGIARWARDRNLKLLNEFVDWIEEEEPKPKPKVWKHTLEDQNLANDMFTRIKKKYRHTTRPTDKFHQWADDIRKIREKYKVSLFDVWSLFIWAHYDSFWSDNIRSPAKLYEKFETLTARRQEGNGHGSNPHIR